MITDAMKKAWAESCGIDEADERAQEPDKYGWPEQFKIFQNAWNAALRTQGETKAAPQECIGDTQSRRQASGAPMTARLTAQEIEVLRPNDSAPADLIVGITAGTYRKLCDLALQSLESVREEAQLYEWLTKCGWIGFQYRTGHIYPNSLGAISCSGAELTDKIKRAMEDQCI